MLSLDNILSMETIAERVRRALTLRGMGVVALDVALGKKQGYTTNLLKRRNTPRSDTLATLASVLNVRLAWLATGEEPMEESTGEDAPPDSSARVSYTALRTPPTLQASEPPASEPTQTHRPAPPDLDQLLDLAYVPTRHAPSDVRAVAKAIESGLLRLPPTPERMLAVRVWLDAAARVREQKGETSVGALVLEMTRELVRHNAVGDAPTKRAS
jgi:hypothetical protein